jgi:hypothetical protein
MCQQTYILQMSQLQFSLINQIQGVRSSKLFLLIFILCSEQANRARSQSQWNYYVTESMYVCMYVHLF